ncbi:MAG: DUF2029 domain-containing protein [Lachnospiraceae bacterium]|nr:DUF2029 domain-containing protein [Lachnospiraceae bacterium]
MIDIKNMGIGQRLLLALLSLIAIVSLLGGIKNGYRFSQDFQYDAAKALVLGYDPYELSLVNGGKADIEELKDFHEYFTGIDAPQKMEANQFPSLLYILAPLTLMPYRTAVVVWMILNIIFTFGIVILLRKTFFKETPDFYFALAALLMIAGTPYRNQLGVGQHTLFSFAAFLLAVYLSDKGKAVWAGLMMAVCYFKYTLTVPLCLYFVYKRRWKELIVSVIPHLICTGVCAAVLNKSPIYLIIEPLKVSMALSGEGSLDVGAISGGGAISLIITALLFAGMIVLSFLMKPKGDKEFFAFTVLVSLIITYHRSYDYFVLTAAMPGVYILSDMLAERSDKAGKALEALYWIMLLYMYFGLRIFHEGKAALAAGGIIYYLFLVLFICAVIFENLVYYKSRKLSGNTGKRGEA